MIHKKVALCILGTSRNLDLEITSGFNHITNPEISWHQILYKSRIYNIAEVENQKNNQPVESSTTFKVK